jgi:hypothetical protein
MTLSARDIEGVLRSVLPAKGECFELRLAGEEPVFETGDGGVRARVQLVVFEDEGRDVRDLKEQELYLLNATERADEARTTAFLRAWGRSVGTIVRLQFGGEAGWVMPCDLLFHEALFEAGAREEADFVALFGSAEWLARKCEAREAAEFVESMASFGLGEHAEELRALRRPSIRLIVDAERHEDEDEDEVEDDSAIGGSRIGGSPDLPPDVAWPRIEGAPLAFLAQINLAELRGLPGAEELPESGLLAFFYDADGRTNHDAEGNWCWPVRHRGGTQVLHFTGDPATFVRTAAPTDTSDPPMVFPAYPVLGHEHERVMPALESPFYEVLDDEPHEQPWYSRFAQVAATSEDDRERPIHRVLGYCSELQGDPYLQAHMYSTGRTFDGWQRNGARERALQREATQWRLLLQIDSTPGDLLCQDGGYFYFLIRADDLAARRFDQVWGISHGH